MITTRFMDGMFQYAFALAKRNKSDLILYIEYLKRRKVELIIYQQDDKLMIEQKTQDNLSVNYQKFSDYCEKRYMNSFWHQCNEILRRKNL